MTMAALVQEWPCSAGGTNAAIPVDIATSKAVALARRVEGTERLDLVAARGRVLATDFHASLDLPPFDVSAMDGYALRRSELTGEGPWILPVGARLAAGQYQSEHLARSIAVRIFTGAAVPHGFDAVVMQERCRRVGNHVELHSIPREHENVRRRGEDVRAGEALLSAGTLLSAQNLALLAGQGMAEVEVLRKVRVGLISTGSELIAPGVPRGQGKIFDSNRIMLMGMLAAWPWVDIIDYGVLPDDPDRLTEAFGKASIECDVLLSSGGVSAGEEDHVVSALERHGGSFDLLKVAMRPGKPVKVGTLKEMLFVGLPGNPNAALVTFRQIASPALKAVAGLENLEPEWISAVAGFTYEKKLGRTEFVPAKIVGRDEGGRPVLEILGRGSSASLSAIALADGIVVLPPYLQSIAIGLPLRFEPF